MSSLNPIEKRKLEKLFNMGGGYVLNFSNRTFSEFIIDITGKQIYDSKYSRFGDSKANRLRGFWTDESNYIAGKLIDALIDIYKEEGRELNANYEECRNIAKRMIQDSPVQDIDALVPNADGREFELLAKSVRDAIESNNPELGLDRLHTFVMKYIRTLCGKRGIAVNKDKPLHSIFGEYVKHLKDVGLVESEMTERILKSSISTLDAFNAVRNNKSLAHDNKTLNYDESILIYNNIASSIRFIRSIEKESDKKVKQEKPLDIDDLPF